MNEGIDRPSKCSLEEHSFRYRTRDAKPQWGGIRICNPARDCIARLSEELWVEPKPTPAGGKPPAGFFFIWTMRRLEWSETESRDLDRSHEISPLASGSVEMTRRVFTLPLADAWEVSTMIPRRSMRLRKARGAFRQARRPQSARNAVFPRM